MYTSTEQNLKVIHFNFIPRKTLKENLYFLLLNRACLGCGQMVVGFTPTYAISAYHH